MKKEVLIMKKTDSPEKRIAKDSLGEIEIDRGALFGAQTQRAINNFPISGRKMPDSFINALIIIKSVAAKTNMELNCIDDRVGEAIISACQALIEDKDFMRHFPIDIFQTGSGTSSNMNANEVIANLASEISGISIDPNDHVNFGQSSNDVIPTAIHVSAVLNTTRFFLPAFHNLIDAIEKKAATVRQVGRT